MNAVTSVPAICVCGGQPNLSSEAPGALFNGNISEKTNLYTYTDAITWTKGKHTFKGGGEVRLGSSFFGDDVEGGNYSAFARAFGGDSPLSPTQNINRPASSATACNSSPDPAPLDASLWFATQISKKRQNPRRFCAAIFVVN